MHISVTEAKARLTDLVRRAEAGEEIVLTRHGKPAVRLVVEEISSSARRRGPEFMAWLADQQELARRMDKGGPSAARSQDFLYDEDGLPG